MKKLEKLVFVNKNGKLGLWSDQDEANIGHYLGYPADGMRAFESIIYRHWDGSCWQPAKFPISIDDIDLCREWKKIPEGYEERYQYPINIKENSCICYYAELITDRDNLTCTLRIKTLKTEKGNLIKMSAPLPYWIRDYEGEYDSPNYYQYDLPNYYQYWHEITFDILESSVHIQRYRLKDLIQLFSNESTCYEGSIELPVTKTNCFIKESFDDADWLIHDSEIEEILLEKIKELQCLAKNKPDSYVSLASKEIHKGYELAKLMTKYPEFFKD